MLVAFGASFISMIALSLFSIGRFTTFTSYSDEVTRINGTITTLFRTEVLFKDIDRWERGYILMGDTVSLNNINATKDSLFHALDSLEFQLKDNPVQARNMIDLRDVIGQRMRCLDNNIAFVASTRSNDASDHYMAGRRHTMAANRQFINMHIIENKVLADLIEKQKFYQKLTTSTLKSLLVIFCLVTLLLFALLIKLMRSGMLYQETLKGKIIDLKRSHDELQEIAYSISHDLQEPLRKIQVFSNMLVVRKANSPEDDGSRDTLQRIHGFANRMQSLIYDLESLTNLTRIDEQKATVNLNNLTEQVVEGMRELIQSRQAVVRIEQLPEIKCYESQLQILFKALLDNALKFVKADTQPEIYIGYRISKGEELAELTQRLPNQQFHCISVSDNGIGFDNKYISNIFKIFRRLHNEESQYSGKGIGLAICQRIMTNHEGYILGEGKPDHGATFKLYFPI